MKKILMTALFLSIFTHAHSEENKMASAQAINTTCTKEAQEAGCPNEKVGTGLLTCFKKYRAERAAGNSRCLMSVKPH
jgi:hypothetical protein